MYETAIASHTAQTRVAAGSLRAIDWPEIVSRLAATRDLRALFARPIVAGGGFVPQSAAGIAGLPTGERGVNLDALATGKWPDVTRAAAAPSAGHGERDN